MGEHHTMAPGPLGRLIHPELLAHRGGGVVGEAQHHQLEAIPFAVRQLVEIGTEALVSPQAQELGLGRGQMEPAQVGGVVGIEQQGPIAGVEHGQGQMGGAFLGSHQQQHFPIPIHRHPETALGPGGYGLAEGPGGAMKAVGGAFGLLQGGGHGRDRCGRGLQVGGAERQIEQGSQSLLGRPLAVGQLALVVAGKDATAQPGQAFRDGHPGRPATGAWPWRPRGGRSPRRP